MRQQGHLPIGEVVLFVLRYVRALKHPTANALYAVALRRGEHAADFGRASGIDHYRHVEKECPLVLARVW